MEEQKNRTSNSENQSHSSNSNPTKDEISEIMKDIRAEVLIESDEDKQLQKSGPASFLLTREMKVSNSPKIDLQMSLDELKKLIKEIVREELNKS